jgi:hypothetical protein
MGDFLENYVNKHREAFDHESPSESVWKKINQQMDETPKSVFNGWKVAAVILLLITSGLLVDKYLLEKEQPNPSSEVLAQFQEAEKFYQQLISRKITEIHTMEDQELRREFLAQLERLDQDYKQLKETWHQSPQHAKVTDAMINNLQLRIRILNQQLLIIQRLKQQKDENDIEI